MINEEVVKYIKLQQGERLLWADKPQGFYIRRSAILYFLIVVPAGYWLAPKYIAVHPNDVTGVKIFVALVLLNGVLMLLSPLKERHFLTTRRIVADYPLMRSSFDITARTRVSKSKWSGKNCLVVHQTFFKRFLILFSAGFTILTLHGVRNPDAFIQKFHNETLTS